ncbi:FkbM family methyltransferase [Campylobacter coli]
MFRKVKYKDGKREIYIGKFRVLKYFRQSQYLEYKFSEVFEAVICKGIYAKGIDHFKILLKRASVAEKYQKLFFDFFLRSQKGEELVFIDAGAHAGVFSDIALASGGICYAFEPNIYLYAFLKDLYKDNEKLILSNKAVSNQNSTTIFYDDGEDVVGQGAGIIKTNWHKESGYEVELIDFCEFLHKILKKYKKITLIKIDIEGAEFDVLDALIEQKLYEHIEYIMVETHERFFENPSQKINTLKEKIIQNNITNIFLDWV